MNDRDIQHGFWESLETPIVPLAPMEDVTDAAFRRIIAKYSGKGESYGGPDVFWTEFTSADGLTHPEAREKLAMDLWYTDLERPIVAQLFTPHPEAMKEATEYCRKLGFDGVDINMGCPERKIVNQGSGCGLIRDYARARDVVYAAKEGAGDMPITVKTRIGFNRDELETWVPNLLETGIPVLTMHMRSKKDMSKVDARWEKMTRLLELRDEHSPATKILGNGDIYSLADAKEVSNRYGCDGAMIARGIFGNPWVFLDKDCLVHDCQVAAFTHNSVFESDREEGCQCVSAEQRLRVMLEHTRLFVELFGEQKNFNVMKKHYKAYCNDFPGAKELRVRLMEASEYETIEKEVAEFLKKSREKVQTPIK